MATEAERHNVAVFIRDQLLELGWTSEDSSDVLIRGRGPRAVRVHIREPRLAPSFVQCLLTWTVILPSRQTMQASNTIGVDLDRATDANDAMAGIFRVLAYALEVYRDASVGEGLAAPEAVTRGRQN